MGLNPLRVGLLIAMALGGLFGGYYLGKEVAPAQKAPTQETAAVSSAPTPPPETAPHIHGHGETGGVYEESLPRNIIIESGGVLKRIGLPEPDAEIDLGNGAAGAAHVADAPKAPEAVVEHAQQQPADAPVAPPVEQKSPTAPEVARLPEPKQDFALPDNIAELQRTDAKSLPAWQRFALPVTHSDKPKIVIVIDDLGLDRRRARRTVKLPGPLTLSFMAYAEDLPKQAASARKAGHELMLHVPMEPSSAAINPGPNVLLSGMPEDELRKNVQWNLDQMSGYVGINNHMGSRFTADADGMKIVVAELKKRGYLFLDSVTSGRSVAHDTARDGGIPFAVRNIFLDHDDDLAAIRTQLRHTEQVARKTGVAIAIGHPRDKTIEALSEWLPKLADKGFQLVPITSVVRIAEQ